MIHLMRYAALQSRWVRCSVVLVYLPVIVLVLILHALEGTMRALHEIGVQMFVTTSRSLQAWFEHCLSGSESVGKEVLAVLRGPPRPSVESELFQGELPLGH